MDDFDDYGDYDDSIPKVDDRVKILGKKFQTFEELTQKDLDIIQELINESEYVKISSLKIYGNACIIDLIMANIENPLVFNYLKGILDKVPYYLRSRFHKDICSYYNAYVFPSKDDLKDALEEDHDYTIELLKEKFAEYYKTLESLGVRISTVHIYKTMDLLGSVNISIFDVCPNIINLLGIDSINYLITKDGGRRPIDNVDNIKYIVIRLFEEYMKQYKNNRNEIDATMIDKFKLLAEELNYQELKDIIADKVLGKATISKMTMYEQGNYLVDELNNTQEVDEEFNDLMSVFNEVVSINPKYQYLKDIYVKCFYQVYSRNPVLAKTTIRLITDLIKTGRIKELLADDTDYYSREDTYGENNGSGYQRGPKTIVIDKEGLNIGTLLHETGHLIHDMLDNSNVPDNFHEIMDRVKQDLDKRGIPEKFYNEIKKIQDAVKEKMYKRLEEDEFFINLFNNFNFEEILPTLNIPHEYIEFIKNNASSELKEKYIKSFKEIVVEDMARIYIETYYPWIRSVSDIIDSIYEGSYLRNHKGVYGHDIDYYKGRDDARFAENFANYYQICSIHPEKMEMIRELFGNEFIELMSNYYDQIVGSYHFSEEKGK